MIQEAYVSFEMAKLLKEKGFDAPCASYNRNGDALTRDWTITKEDYYPRCTQQMACEWLRQEHNLSVEVYRTACGWIGCVVAIPSGTDLKFLEDDGDDLPSGQYTTHAKACEATIKYCLENLIK